MQITRTLKFLLLIVVLQFLVSCGPSTVNQLVKKTDAKHLTPDEILSMAKGNTLFIHTHKLNSYVYFDESGNMYAKDIYNNKDTGYWDVSDQGELCFKLSDWWFGKLRCFPVYYDGSKYYLFNNSGVLEFTADYMKGDAKSLYYTLKKSKRKFLMDSNREEKTGKTSSPENITTDDRPQIIYEGGPTEEELKSTVKWMAKDCPGCNLAKTNLSGADLVGAKLQGANLSGANLSKANLRRAELHEANLEKADLSYANMPGASLRDCNLSKAVFKGANLIRADFTGANIEGATFEGALLEGVIGLDK